MTQESTRGGALLVACMEIASHARVLEFLRHLWNIESFAILPGTAPETAFIEADPNPVVNTLRATLDTALGNPAIQFLVLVAHQGCTMNPAPYHEQIAMLRRARDYWAAQYSGKTVAGIWIGDDGIPRQIEM